MSLKTKLSEINKDKHDLENELTAFISEKIMTFQAKHKIAVTEISVYDRQLPKTIDEYNMPNYCYIESVNIDIDEKKFIIDSID